MNTQELLQRFVAQKFEIREYMQEPIIQGEFIYATNGHIAVRVQKAVGIVATEGDKPRDMFKLFEDNRRDSFVDIPALPDAILCGSCRGSGVAYKCPDCYGGKFRHGRHKYECQECNGSAQVDDGPADKKEACNECGGSGHSSGQRVRIASIDYDRRYLAMIIGLPGAKFAPPPVLDRDRPAYFFFDGGDGLLMPMRELGR